MRVGEPRLLPAMQASHCAAKSSTAGAVSLTDAVMNVLLCDSALTMANQTRRPSMP